MVKDLVRDGSWAALVALGIAIWVWVGLSILDQRLAYVDREQQEQTCHRQGC